MRTLLLLVGLLVGCPPGAKPDDTGSIPPGDADADGHDERHDCDDEDPSVFPGAEEVCNGVDDDCDGYVDLDDPGLVDALTYYTDADGDGFGDPDSLVRACEPDSSLVATGDDCDDANDAVNPEASEVCNGIDDDCDGTVDQGASDATTWYLDGDGDGWGDEASSTVACERPSGHVAGFGDCDDDQSAIHPDATEACNGLDDDCDGEVDEDTQGASTWYPDSDGDGYGDDDGAVVACEPPSGHIALGGDCDDEDAGVSPAALEDCDGVDDDCDGAVDEDAVDATAWYLDNDGDGYGWSGGILYACSQPSGYASSPDDCNDADAGVNPGATEICDGVDDDCDGAVDVGAADAPTWYADVDGDGWGDSATATVDCAAPSGSVASAGDCDDADAAINPAATEVCNGVDDDCDGAVDVGASDAPTWYGDSDGDGYGDGSASIGACTQPTDAVADSSDCDDSDAGIHPGADEHCDGVDEDCDGAVDEDAVDVTAWFADADGDGWGDADDATTACSQPTGTVAGDGDCDDGDADVHPGAHEHCDGVDEDCDGAVDEDAVDVATWYADTDGDGYGDPATSAVDCSAPSGFVADSSDCDDSETETHPGADEYCDGVDTDCDGTLDPVDTVSFLASGGGKSDVTSSFLGSSSGAPSTYAFSTDGQLSFCAGSYFGLISVSAASASIVGLEGSSATELSGGFAGMVVSTAAGAAALSIEGMTLSDGYGSNGGAIGSAIVGLDFAAEDLVVAWSAATNGGGLYIKDAASISLWQVEIQECAAAKGGALYIDEGELDFVDLWVGTNAASNQGGGLYLKDAYGVATGMVVSDNAATSKGGGLYVEDTQLLIEDSVISDNVCADMGGGLNVKGGADVTLSGTAVQDNIADEGGGLYLESSLGACEGSATSGVLEGFHANYATLGGALYVKGGSASWTATTCDMGSGVEDNFLLDVRVEAGGLSYSYADDASFACSDASCW